MRPALFVVVLVASLLTFFPTLWSLSARDNGCGMDPSGCPGAAQPVPDHGCIMDPNGCPRGE